MFTKIRNLLVIMAVMLTMAACSTEEGAPRMLWEVFYTPEDNVYAVAYLDYHPQITILANNKEGEVTLKCTNYSSLSLVDQGNKAVQELRVPNMNILAKVIEGNTIKITFEEMSETFEVPIETTLRINAFNGVDNNMSAARITRMPDGPVEP